jgi:hypothetical protein
MTALDLVRFQTVAHAVAGVEDPAARRALTELSKAVEQIQRHQMQARKTESDGLPSDNQLSEQFNGEFIRITSKGFVDLVHTVKHGLKRVPQGCIFVRKRTANNECLIEGDAALDIPAATDTEVTFIIGDPAGQVVVGLLI